MYNKELSTMEPLEGPIQFAHQFVDMPEYNVQVKTNRNIVEFIICDDFV